MRGQADLLLRMHELHREPAQKPGFPDQASGDSRIAQMRQAIRVRARSGRELEHNEVS